MLGRGMGLHAILLHLAQMYGREGTAPSVAASEGGPHQALVFLVNTSKEQLLLLEEDLLLQGDLAAGTGQRRTRPIRIVNQAPKPETRPIRCTPLSM